MENIKYIHNSSYVIDNLNIKKEKRKLFILIIIILIQILILINFKYTQTISFETTEKEVTLGIKTKNIDLFINNIKYNKKLNISMEKFNYQLKIDLNNYNNKRIKIKVNEKLSILDSILYNIRKDLYNERTK